MKVTIEFEVDKPQDIPPQFILISILSGIIAQLQAPSKQYPIDLPVLDLSITKTIGSLKASD